MKFVRTTYGVWVNPSLVKEFKVRETAGSYQVVADETILLDLKKTPDGFKFPIEMTEAEIARAHAKTNALLKQDAQAWLDSLMRNMLDKWEVREWLGKSE